MTLSRRGKFQEARKSKSLEYPKSLKAASDRKFLESESCYKDRSFQKQFKDSGLSGTENFLRLDTSRLREFTESRKF
ncbi:hypothetical protein J6590_021380 [Homalodisca vitripennis]|nr:hypothetical protein J6590_021380 [Homalodisca vitripennis]